MKGKLQETRKYLKIVKRDVAQDCNPIKLSMIYILSSYSTCICMDLILISRPKTESGAVDRILSSLRLTTEWYACEPGNNGTLEKADWNLLSEVKYTDYLLK